MTTMSSVQKHLLLAGPRPILHIACPPFPSNASCMGLVYGLLRIMNIYHYFHDSCQAIHYFLSRKNKFLHLTARLTYDYQIDCWKQVLLSTSQIRTASSSNHKQPAFSCSPSSQSVHLACKPIKLESPEDAGPTLKRRPTAWKHARSIQRQYCNVLMYIRIHSSREGLHLIY